MNTQPRFQIIPDNNELDRIERDLRYHPLGVENPRTLTRDRIAAFNRDGFIKGVRIFDEDEIAGHRRYFDDLLARVLAEGGDSYSISTAHLKYPEVYDLLTHPRIVAVVKDLLGENVVGWGSHYFCKMPRDGKRVSWHQDASYWPLTPSKTVTVWLAIDDAEVENACVRFIPGSHLYGHLTWQLSENDEGNVLNQTVAEAERFGAPVDAVLRAGEISVHSDLTLHGSEANESDRRRCGLTLRYCAADVRAFMGWNAKGVVVSGADADGHWANAGRPVADEQRQSCVSNQAPRTNNDKAEIDREIIQAPWTPEQVAGLNRYQQSPNVHPYTCGGNRKDEWHLDGEGVLIATEAGWSCPYCNYTQNWAIAFTMKY